MTPEKRLILTNYKILISNSNERTSKQSSDKNFVVLTKAFVCCFTDNAFFIDNAFLNKAVVYSKYIVKDQKFRKLKMQQGRRND